MRLSLRVSLYFTVVMICLLAYSGQATARQCSKRELRYALGNAKQERAYIQEHFSEMDVSLSVDKFEAALNRCDIPLSSFGLGSGALDYWKKQGYRATYNRAKERLEYASKFRPDPQSAAEMKMYATKLGLDAVETNRLTDKALSEGNRNLAIEKARCQPSVDLRGDSLGQVRDQDSIGWCYAFAAADLLSFKLGKKISAADIAISNNDNWQNGILKRFGKSETNFVGGFAETAIERSKSKGWCLESKLSSEDNSNWDLRSMLLEVEELKKKASKAGPDFLASCANATQIFKGLDTTAVVKVLGNTSSAALLPTLADKSCHPRISRQSIKTQSNSILFSSDKSPLFQDIDTQLDKKNVTGISYSAAVLYNRDYKKSIGNHGSVIVGRRFNSKTNECDYLIRNSWGRSCSQYDHSYDCEEGNIWVPKPALHRGIYEIQYIK